MLCNIKSKAEIIKDLILIKNKDIINLNGFEYFRTDNFEIEFEDALGSSWCLDGEEYSTINNSFKFSVNKDCKILLPKKNIEKLFVD